MTRAELYRAIKTGIEIRILRSGDHCTISGRAGRWTAGGWVLHSARYDDAVAGGPTIGGRVVATAANLHSVGKTVAHDIPRYTKGKP
jgi:hypothetical protein